MIVEILISNLAAELEKLSHTKPNERRPKEEHSRSVIFRELSCFGFSVAVERAYTPVEAGGTRSAISMAFRQRVKNFGLR